MGDVVICGAVDRWYCASWWVKTDGGEEQRKEVCMERREASVAWERLGDVEDNSLVGE